MSNEVIVTDATIVERVPEGTAPKAIGMRFPEMLLWTVLSILWYSAVRLVVVGFFAVMFVAAGPSRDAAQSWLWLGIPLGTGIAAFLTLQTNLRNRQLHFVMSIVVFLSAVLFHVDWTLNNPVLVKGDSSLTGVAWFLQAAAILVMAAISLAVANRRRAKWATQPLMLRSSE